MTAMDVAAATLDVGEWTSQMIGDELLAIVTERQRLDGRELALLRELSHREQAAPAEYVQRVSRHDYETRRKIAARLDELPGAGRRD